MPQPPKKPESSPTDALWDHVTQLHKKHGELAAQMASGQPDSAQTAMIVMAIVQGMQGLLQPLLKLMSEAAERESRTLAVLEVLASPRTRTGRVNLPDGPVEMTITEAHETHKEH